MDFRKNNNFRVPVISLIAVLVIELFVYSIFGGVSQDTYTFISFLCVILCAGLATLFIDFTRKEQFICYALLLNIASDYFLVLNYSSENFVVGVSIFVAVQFMFAIYTILLNKTLLTKLVNIISRVVITATATTLLAIYFNLAVHEILAVIYITNFVLTLFWSLIYIKHTWVFSIGTLFYIICDVVVGITNGGADIFGFSGSFIDFLYTYDVAYWFYIPAVLLIAVYSALKISKNDNKKIS